MLLIAVLIIMLAAFYEFYIRIYQPNTFHLSNENNKEIFIPSEASFDNVIDILKSQELLIDVNSFIWLAKQKNYDDNVKPGRYMIGKDINNNDLINLLRSGRQSPVNVTFNNVRTIEQLASKIASQIEADSTSIINYITDIVEQLDLDIIAIQELSDTNMFDQMLDGLPDYTGYYESSWFAGLAYIYKTDVIDVNDIYEIYTTSPYWSAFPRSPMVMISTLWGRTIFLLIIILNVAVMGILILIMIQMKK